MTEGVIHYTSTDIFTGPGQKARIELAAGERIILLFYGTSPQLAPIEEPGKYEIDCDIISTSGRWPMAAIVIKMEHLSAWQSLPPEEVSNILDQCGAVVENMGRKMH